MKEREIYRDPDMVKDAMTPARRIADALFTLAEAIYNMGLEAAATKKRESFYGDNDERDTVRELIAEVREWLDDLEGDVKKGHRSWNVSGGSRIERRVSG